MDKYQKQELSLKWKDAHYFASAIRDHAYEMKHNYKDSEKLLKVANHLDELSSRYYNILDDIRKLEKNL